MKKLIVFILVLLLIFTFNVFDKYQLYEFDFSETGKYFLYTTTQLHESEDYEIIENGNGFIITSPQKNALKVISLVRDYSGEAIEFITQNTSELLGEILEKLNVKIIKINTLNNTTVYEGYSNYLSGFIMADLNKVNLQIAVSQNKLLVGTPLILHSF